MSHSCWILTPGQAGFKSQAIGLAEALGVSPEFKRIATGWPWRRLPGTLWPSPLNRLSADSDRLAPPWPDLIISCGRVAAPVAAAVRRASNGRTRVVHIQNPLMPPDRFDLVVAPQHDGVEGPNVIQSVGAIHPVTTAKLAAAVNHWMPPFNQLPRPLIGVLVGGSNGRFKLGAAETTQLADRLAGLVTSSHVGLAITASRRTGADNEAILHARLKGPSSFIWDGQGENPYLGILGLADAIIVTEDSVSMTSEALATGKPVYVVRLPGDSARLRQFQDGLIEQGYTRPFTGVLDHWSYTPPDDTARAAAECRRRFGWS